MPINLERMCDYSSFCGQGEGNATEAEVDHGAEGVEVSVAESAALYESDLGVDAFEA